MEIFSLLLSGHIWSKSITLEGKINVQQRNERNKPIRKGKVQSSIRLIKELTPCKDCCIQFPYYVLYLFLLYSLWHNLQYEWRRLFPHNGNNINSFTRLHFWQIFIYNISSTYKYLVPRQGFEPHFLGPKPSVLPLDDRGILVARRGIEPRPPGPYLDKICQGCLGALPWANEQYSHDSFTRL